MHAEWSVRSVPLSGCLHLLSQATKKLEETKDAEFDEMYKDFVEVDQKAQHLARSAPNKRRTRGPRDGPSHVGDYVLKAHGPQSSSYCHTVVIELSDSWWSPHRSVDKFILAQKAFAQASSDLADDILDMSVSPSCSLQVMHRVSISVTTLASLSMTFARAV